MFLCHSSLTSCRRINKKTDRKDFLTRILEHRDEENISDIQIAAHASDFVLAGSETTATALSCITYYLLHTPHALRALQDEIRGTFSSYGQINASSTAPLRYLQAVALEGMRIYPPLPFPLPRVVPDGGDIVDGHLLPGGVGVCMVRYGIVCVLTQRFRPVSRRIHLQLPLIRQISRILKDSCLKDG